MQTTNGADHELTAVAETRIAGGTVSEDRVNLPERKKLKKTRYEAAQSKRTLYWSATSVDHAERCHMTAAVIGRRQLLSGA